MARWITSEATRLVADADPTFQQDLEGRVERLMTARGVAPEWGDDLEPPKSLRFETDAAAQENVDA
jgi:hypothetical protein